MLEFIRNMSTLTYWVVTGVIVIIGLLIDNITEKFLSPLLVLTWMIIIFLSFIK